MRPTGGTGTRALGVILTVVTLAGMGCVPSNVTTGGPLSTREYDIADFTAVQVNSSPLGPQVYHRLVVDIVPSDTYSVSVTANDNLLKRIYVDRSDSTLRIELRDVEVSFSPATLEVRVAVPQLRQITASGAAEVSARGFKSTDDFNLEISDGARADLDIETGDFEASIKGGRASGSVMSADARIEVFGIAGAAGIDGSAELSGSARDLVLRGGIGADADLHGFTVHNADVMLSGLGTRADVTVNGRLDVTLMGPAMLWYSGETTLGSVSEGRGSMLRERP